MQSTDSLREAETRSSTSVEMLQIRSPTRDPSRDSRDEHGKTKKRWKPSRFPWKTFFVTASLPMALLPIVVLSAAAEVASQSYILGRDCYPNGMWEEATGATWRIMDSSYFFTPNLSFGAMTFTQVKVIDITWDLLVGRGGQMLLAWVNYRVFNEWLLYHMEMHRTSYKMYTAVAFQTTTLGTLGVLGKEFLAFGEGTWKRFFRWLAVLCMLLSTLYVLAFPTLMAAMTGYITTYEPYIEDANHNLAAWSEIEPVRYVVKDSNRLGEEYTAPLVAVLSDPDLMKAIKNYSDHYMDFEFDFEKLPGIQDQVPTLISVQRNLSSTFVFNGSTVPLEAPSLNITYAIPGGRQISPALGYPLYSLEASRQGATYSDSYIHTHGSCKPSETYQWGFSYIFLFMVAIFNFVWSCIMVGMWFDTRRGSRMYRSGRRPGLLRSILDVAGAMKEEVGECDDEGCGMGEEELRKKLAESGGALVVPKRELRVARVDTGDGGLKSRGWRSLTKGSTF
ncbi:hypothetical protein N0V90_001338 [Kalmusia sp. IMI 367209]|nr:hypothetical protein N0V90_001338 [Kalmusia sp. IMI 367209]